jgi:hypothetical protein
LLLSGGLTALWTWLTRDITDAAVGWLRNQDTSVTLLADVLLYVASCFATERQRPLCTHNWAVPLHQKDPQFGLAPG